METIPPQLVQSDEGIWLMFDQGHYVRPATAEEITLWQRLSYAENFLADFEHLHCEDDCEGFRDPCLACVVHEALRRIRAR